MQIDITAESLLNLLKLNVTENSLKQMDDIIDKTNGALHFFKHLFSLNDALAHMDAFIAPSSSVNYLKIKYHGEAIPEQVLRFHDTVGHWGEKYKVELEKVDGKDTYYIKGLRS